ncbi:bifunctional NADP phosphatase/NAD kinase [Methanobrevibacter millerae]|uniref:NAD kinase n=1 Tax=Methanobrevibacter millerae TaxID=230361 RepID=A0A0U3EM01_9EURY|nr:bifunctional NADP phosphatase/NAD kinase [Methanobrevibacter millerae]ALT69597.1 bifunctional inositol-1 monophosphatase/fructose-1,6-bisphosphatase/ATP-NAD kinase [Methanobrevibacter millerae]MBP3226939.1 bifunctional NADP phosphatase/NAD kinase [Methanobrevibacter sp.]
MDAKDKKIATDLAYEIIREVSIAIRPYAGTPEAGEKVKMGADGTPTSYIDIIAEDKVINILKNAPVLSYIISEEVGELKLGKGTKRSINLSEELKRDDLTEEETPKFIFLVDPIDGTSNAIKEIPAYGISIAVANVPEGRLATLNDVELGFISNFGNGNFFEAEKGKGCWLNNERVHPSDVINISQMTLGGFTKSGTSSASKLVDNARRMRVLGSVVLELSYVASGRYDAFLDLRGSRIIDVAASKLIVEEAGGIITSKHGEKLNNKLSIYEKAIVVAANNKILHKQIINILNDNEADIIGKVGILSRVDQEKAILFSAKLVEYFLTNGIEVVVEKRLASKIEELKQDPKIEKIIEKIIKKCPDIAEALHDLNLNIDFMKIAKDTHEFECDMAVVLGGDGTLLRAQAKLKEETPLLGINMGTVGFLTDVEVKETFNALNKIIKGDYYKEKRSKLMVSHENHYFNAMNEVVIMTNKPAKMLHFEIQVDGETIEEVRADGLIISTPSGSTAYAMSAGGPIVDPKLEGLIIIPICPYKLGARPFIVSDTSEITVKLLKKGKSAVFVMDGQINEEADYLEEIKFKKADKDVYFIRTSSKYFYEKVKDKLKEGGLKKQEGCL